MLEHGIEIIEIAVGGVVVEEVRSSVHFVVGTAPVHLTDTPTVNEPILISDQVSAARYFGSYSDPNTAGYTLPQAVYLLGLNKFPVSVFVNVFDPDTMTSLISDQSRTFVGDTLSLVPSSSLVSVKSADGTTTYPGTAYTYDPATGVLSRNTSGPISANATVRVSYNAPDPTQVELADIIGGISAEYERTGLQLIDECWSRFGFNPKIIICPGFSHNSAVAGAMKAASARPRAQALIDAPPGTTMRQALESRGSSSAVPAFLSAEERAIYLYPNPMLFDPAQEAVVEVPYSALMGGVIAKTDRELGYWYSPSSKSLSSAVEALTVYPSWHPEDFETEANLLNEAGIVTIIRRYGGSFQTWGNRNSSYPTNTRPTNFIATRRTLDIIYESLVYASLQYLDLQLTRGWIDSVLETVNEFLNVLVGRGALYIGSKCLFDPSKNALSTLQQGRVRFTLSLMSPPPVEKIEYEVALDVSLLRSVFESPQNEFAGIV